ncbi:M81 family metallopeptidase, partial [Rhizobium johnstonii]|uniref:M81 family metallopeptidase n=1 Tax=Rhizobium johnstonii TaxID=3019933 RepID=UPI003F9D00E4
FPTSREPMRSFVDKIMQIEKDDPDFLSISVIHGFMVGDVPEMGTKLLVVTDDKPEKGAAIARATASLSSICGTMKVTRFENSSRPSSR